MESWFAGNKQRPFAARKVFPGKISDLTRLISEGTVYLTELKRDLPEVYADEVEPSEGYASLEKSVEELMDVFKDQQ
jgi:hypothetical protein